MDALGYDRVHDDLFPYHHKRKISKRVHDDLFRYHHKRKFSKRIHDDLFRYHHKCKFSKRVNDDLFRYHHKRKLSRRIQNDPLPVAWHPDRFLDWCVDEEEKRFFARMWRVSES